VRLAIQRLTVVAVHDWVLHFYRRTYRVDEVRARLLRRSQWLEWTADAGF
jgi:iron complex transport system substrate-binding protein